MERNEKIVLSKELQEEMLQFFLRTSIPKKKRQQLLSQKDIGERDEGNENRENEK